MVSPAAASKAFSRLRGWAEALVPEVAPGGSEDRIIFGTLVDDPGGTQLVAVDDAVIRSSTERASADGTQESTFWAVYSNIPIPLFLFSGAPLRLFAT